MKRFLKFCSLVLILSLLLPYAGSFPTTAEAAALPFTDVSTNHDYYDAIKYVYENGIMVGTTTTTFSPSANLTRGQIVAILYRISGSTAQIAPNFDDVPSYEYYYYPIGWAQSEGIAYGTSVDLFEPEAPVTRQQALMFLYRYATRYEGRSYNLVSSTLYQSVTDASSIDSTAREAVNWAINCGIIAGGTSYVRPGWNAERGLCAQYLYGFLHLAFGDARVSTRTNLDYPGNPETVLASLEEMGYEAYMWHDLEPYAMEFNFYNSNFIFTHSHGVDTGIQMKYPGGGIDPYLDVNDIDSGRMSNVDLVYISACEAGGSFCEALQEIGGAQIAIGFTDPVYAYTNYDGIHKFNQMFFYYYGLGYTIETSRQYALADVLAQSQMYGHTYIDQYGEEKPDPLGCDSFVVYPEAAKYWERG